MTAERAVRIDVGRVALDGDLTVPARARGLVLFAHGSGSSRRSGRNRAVAAVLHRAGLATLLFDLLSPAEEAAERDTGHLRFNLGLLADRLAGATTWAAGQEGTAGLPVGYFGASTGGGAALVAAARRPAVRAVVSRGGRPDLAGDALPLVTSPTLLLVGGHDGPVIDLNREAFDRLGTPAKQLVIIPGASHLFAEPGTLEQVADLAADWFTRHLAAPAR